MLKKIVLPVLLLLAVSAFSQSGTGSISGTIISVNNEPLEMVSVSLLELKKTTLTDTKGNDFFFHS